MTGADQAAPPTLMFKTCECSIDFAVGADVENPDLQPYRLRTGLHLLQCALRVDCLGRSITHGGYIPRSATSAPRSSRITTLGRWSKPPRDPVQLYGGTPRVRSILPGPECHSRAAPHRDLSRLHSRVARGQRDAECRVSAPAHLQRWRYGRNWFGLARGGSAVCIRPWPCCWTADCSLAGGFGEIGVLVLLIR